SGWYLCQRRAIRLLWVVSVSPLTRDGRTILSILIRRGAGLLSALLLTLPVAPASAQGSGSAQPTFGDGQAQVVPAFADPEQWSHHRLWVEAEFDSDGDGQPDRLHVDVFRPRQTETEGLKVPVIYETSPYYAGVSGAREFLWDVRQELGDPPPPRTNQPPIPFEPERTTISTSHVKTWVPRGFAVVH